MNEDSLFGSEETGYSPFNEYSWNNDREDNGVGKDETGMALALQIKMTLLLVIQCHFSMIHSPCFMHSEESLSIASRSTVLGTATLRRMKP